MPAKSHIGADSHPLLCNFGLLLLLACVAGTAAGAESDAMIPNAAETYAGVFAAAARPDNRIVDQDGFANWGNPGWSVAYGRRGFVAGALAGMKTNAAGIPLRIELDRVFGAGIEVSLPDLWTLRLEGSHLDFGRETHRVNHSGSGRCGPGGVRKPCPYTVENKLRILRLAITRRFGR